MFKTCLAIVLSMLIVVTVGELFGVEPDFIEVEQNNTPAQANVNE